ncbi:sensor histidine kinase [Salipaludibacillus aurantiacus]|uniref:histidine kinase n=1 Tax=Salipaludibacillus aurantiacus TaxID=1601833 RepID=A0A1H9TZ66_9BACI|nr:ATP-binding protein [Salipaludibacillus aurantiacus]SES02352.1 PAS fold-containing protein [Salipaludibacillus aurantiacus]
MKHLFRSVRYKVLLFGLIMSIIPLVLISVYYLMEMSDYVEDSAAVSQERKVAYFAETIRNDIRSTFQKLDMMMSMGDLEDQSGVFYDLLKQQESIDEIVLLNAEGEVQSRYSRYSINQMAEGGLWVSGQAELSVLANDNHVFSNVMFNDYGQPFIQLIVRSEENGEMLGVSLQLQKLIGNVSSYQMEHNAQVYLRDQNEQIIAHQDYSRLWQTDQRTEVPDNTMVIQSSIDEVNWDLVMEQPRREMLSPIFDMLRRGSFTASFMILFGSMISIYAGLYFVKPIERLQSGMKHMQYGYWPEKMPVDRNDEFGELTAAFNDMNTEIQEKERRLEQEKERLDIVVNSMDAGLAVVKKDYSIAWMNPTLKSWIGDQRSVPCFRMFNDKDSPCYSCPLNESASFERMDENLTKTDENGEQRIYRHRVFPLQHTLEEDEEVLIVMEDITEEKRMEEKLVQTDKLSALGLMASSFAHEVNNPLASVQVYAEDLTDRLEEDKEELLESGEMADYLTIIRKNINRCKEITNNLLNFSRKSAFKAEEFPIEKVLDDSLMLMNHTLKKNHVSLKLQKPQEKIPDISGDPLKISQVFVNLIQNAVDAMSEKEFPVLEITVEMEGEEAVVSFKDNGIGIPESNIPKLFDPFFTSKPTGKGTGLGLSVCYGIVKQMEGTMEVQSEPGEGSVFRVILPVNRKDADGSEGESE